MPAPITASMLFDLITCPHRVTQDLFANPADRDEINSFVQLLWEKGALHERETIEGLELPFLDLSKYAGADKERRTTEAIQRGESLIYGGRIAADDLLGDPDLLRRQDPGYVAGDIKSGAGEEGTEDLSQPKLHYGVQLALYQDILERRAWSGGRTPFVWDIHGEEVTYDLDAPMGVKSPTTLWEQYEEYLAQARLIVLQDEDTAPAYASGCKLCWWHSHCIRELERRDDLTLIPELGRSRRNSLGQQFHSIEALAKADVSKFVTGKKTVFPGIGPDTLVKFQERAKLLKSVNPKPYLKESVKLPVSDLEIFFDIEVDPLRDLCYLHGIVERQHQDNSTERYIAFFAEAASDEAEKAAFARAWEYFRTHESGVIYHYSPYERTWWRNLQKRYPDVCASEDIEALFHKDRAVDLYNDVVRSKMEWPTRDHSIKTLAKFLGFAWRDLHPSGAASIEWFDRWVTTGDPTVKQRILDYNEDDCRATRWLLDGIRSL